jgi:hypothetical protein
LSLRPLTRPLGTLSPIGAREKKLSRSSEPGDAVNSSPSPRRGEGWGEGGFELAEGAAAAAGTGRPAILRLRAVCAATCFKLLLANGLHRRRKTRNRSKFARALHRLRRGAVLTCRSHHVWELIRLAASAGRFLNIGFESFTDDRALVVHRRRIASFAQGDRNDPALTVPHKLDVDPNRSKLRS